MIQIPLTISACKRLIAKGILKHPDVQKALTEHTLVIVAGTTNGYIAEEILKRLGYDVHFPKNRFFRGITTPPNTLETTENIPIKPNNFIGDLVFIKGKWEQGKTIFDVVHTLNQGDVILKGANALDPVHRRAGIFVAHPEAGTIGAIIPAVIGRRVKLIIPIGLEKRIYGDLDHLAQLVNNAHSTGPRLFPVPGEVFTEIDALHVLTGARAELIGGGGVNGAEGAIWLAIHGTEQQELLAQELINEVSTEPPFKL